MFGYLGEIRLVAFNFIPKNYVLCDGRRLSKSTDRLLYLIVGDSYTYDNSDSNTFAIPDLRDRFILQPESESGLGSKKGNDNVVLSMNQMPEHNHETHIEVDNTNGGEEPQEFPKNTFLNNQAGNFSSASSEDTFLGGISQDNVGKSDPIQIKNAHVKMVYVMCVQADSGSGFIGELRIWPNSKIYSRVAGTIPKGWRLCNGDTYSIANNSALASVIGDLYGKSKLPDFRNKFATGVSNKDSIGETGGNTSIRLEKSQLPQHTHNVQLAVNNNADSTPHTQVPNNAFINSNAGMFSSEINASASLGGVLQDDRGGLEEINIENTSLGLNYIICVSGLYPRGRGNGGRYLGEIMLFAGVNPNRLESFASCYGQRLGINSTLYGLIGTMYGGDGKTTFDLPNLRNKIPLCVSNLNEVGKAEGANKIKLTPDNLPAHNHNVQLTANHTSDGRLVEIPNGILNKDAAPYSTKESENAFLAGVKEIHFSGEKIDIRNPFLGISYLICIDDHLYPARN